MRKNRSSSPLRHRRLIITLSLILLIIIVTIGTGWQIMNSRTFQFFGGLVSRVETTEKVVALTFDDGPTKNTDTILQILEEQNIKATFFLVGESIEKYPSETRNIVEAGHQLANHTYSHPRMVFKTLSSIAEEIEKTDKLIKDAGYQGEIYFRPPTGKKLILLPYYLNQHQRTTIMWDVEAEKFDGNPMVPQEVISETIKQTRSGSIILLHPMGYKTTDEVKTILTEVIQELKQQGYQFKTINELLALA